MKHFKLYVEIVSPIGSKTFARLDKFSNSQDLIDLNQLALHMYNQNMLIAKDNTKSYEVMVVKLPRERFDVFKKEINLKQKNILGDTVIISDGVFPLVRIIKE